LESGNILNMVSCLRHAQQTTSSPPLYKFPVTYVVLSEVLSPNYTFAYKKRCVFLLLPCGNLPFFHSVTILPNFFFCSCPPLAPPFPFSLTASSFSVTSLTSASSISTPCPLLASSKTFFLLFSRDSPGPPLETSQVFHVIFRTY